MTALAGFWGLQGGGDPRRSCERMLNAQQVYAPSAPAIWAGGAVALGRRLHPLLPEDACDRRPVSGRGGALTLIADVRLDDRQGLGQELGVEAAELKLLADSALLMRAFERWGDEALVRVFGDFALALWDAGERRLLLARDFVGQKPLHFHRAPGFFAFASMPKGLHALPDIPRSPDRNSAVDFLALMPETGTETFFEAIEKVPPGHKLIVQNGAVRIERWWKPAIRPLILPRSSDYAEALREQLDRAVAARLRGADGAVATHLSAGLDSSAVTATAAKLLAPERGRVVAFTSVPGGRYAGQETGRVILDEGPLAARVAAMHPNIEHVLIRAGDRSPAAGLDRALFLYERPYLNPANGVWLHAINDAARERGLKVLLTGQKGNLSFSYDGIHLLPELLARGRLLRLAALTFRLKRGGTRVGTVAAQALGPFLPHSLWRRVQKATGRTRDLRQSSAISADAAQRLAQSGRAEQRRLDVSYRPRRDGLEARLWMLNRVDGGNYNKGVLGGWGIDQRDPTADRRLVEFCLSVPVEQYIAAGVPRALARNALADRLPAQLLAERRKGFQAADWAEGLKAAQAELREEVERIGRNGVASELLDTARLGASLDHLPIEGWDRLETVQRYRLALLRGVSAGHFIRKVSGDNQ
jgi:asparagine synthase (glutamine-hydrolysing)